MLVLMIMMMLVVMIMMMMVAIDVTFCLQHPQTWSMSQARSMTEMPMPSTTGISKQNKLEYQ